MKKSIINILIALIPFIWLACSKPLPTELTEDNSSQENGLEINTISSDSELLYSNGYDSTGTELTIPKASSIISVSSIKTSYKTRTNRTGLAEAIFFDRGAPVMHPNGRIIGYRTKNPGVVSFDNIPARLMPFVTYFKDKGAIKDTLLGQYYLLYKYNNSGDPFTFVHNSRVVFKLKFLMNKFEEIEIPTPEEISGEITVNGSLKSKDLSFLIRWEPADQGKIGIVISGFTKGNSGAVPLIKLFTSDKGKVNIPASLLKDYPLENFDRIIFTLTRKKITEYQPVSIILKDNLIVAQTIHSIQLDIPK